jgi:hypothetical protein
VFLTWEGESNREFSLEASMSRVAVAWAFLTLSLISGYPPFHGQAYGAGAAVQVLTTGGSDQTSSSTSTEAGSPAEGLKSGLQVTWGNRLVTIDALNADLTATMQTLSEKSGVGISLFEGISGMVTLHEERVPLETAVDRVLAAAGS